MAGLNEINSLGNRQHYGPRDVDKALGNTIGTSEREKNLEYVFDYANFPGTSEDDQGIVQIPAGAVVVEARLNVTTAFSGGSISKFDVGLSKPDGTAVDADGLINDGSATSAGWVTGAGALIGASTGADATQVVVAPLTAADAAATPTAGEAKLYLKVLLPQA